MKIFKKNTKYERLSDELEQSNIDKNTSDKVLYLLKVICMTMYFKASEINYVPSSLLTENKCVNLRSPNTLTAEMLSV